MSGISFTGLASGIDTGALVDALVNAERQPIRLLQTKQSNLNKISSRLSTIEKNLDALSEAAKKLDARNEVLFSKATSSDESKVGVTASGGASLGSFKVEVTSLATAERTYSNPFTANDESGLFGTGTLTIQVGSDLADAVNIEVTASDTLETLVSKINSSGAGVTAGAFYDGTQYRLQVSGNGTGADKAITFTEAGTTLGLDDPANEYVAAADAVFTIDDFPMTSPSNTVEGAVPGVTLSLKAGLTGPVDVAVSRDSEALEENVRAFVDAYNTVMKGINAEFAFLGEARVGDSLSGDATLRGLQNRLRGVAGSVLDGIADPYNRLSSIGITFEQSGTLGLDETKLASALADDAEAVGELFAGDSVAGVGGMMAAVQALVTEYNESGTGILASRIKGIGARVRDMTARIDQMEVRIDKFEENMVRQFSQMEQLISSIQQQGNQMLAILGGGAQG